MGDEDGDPKAARIVAVDADGNVALEVLAGSVGSRSNLLAPVSAKADLHTLTALLVAGWARCLLSAVEGGRDDRRTGHVTD